MHNPDAFFDILVIISELEQPLNGVSRLEIQRLTYLACLMSVYEGRPVAEWGYRFARTEFGTPYSPAINDALEALKEMSRISQTQGRFRLLDAGTLFRNALAQLRSQKDRMRYLRAASGSALLVPAGTLSEAIDNEPTVRRALHRDSGGGLLEGAALSLLHKHFENLSEAVDRRGGDLLTPSVVWLSYVSNQMFSQRTDVSVHE